MLLMYALKNKDGHYLSMVSRSGWQQHLDFGALYIDRTSIDQMQTANPGSEVIIYKLVAVDDEFNLQEEQ